MREILDGKLYDTEKCENLCNFNNHSVYRTKNGKLFMTCYDFGISERMSCTNEEEIKNAVGHFSPDDYIKIWGEVEEA